MSKANLEVTIDRTLPPQGSTVPPGIPGATIIQISGDVRVDNVDELERQLLPVAALRPSLLIVDISNLSFISSLGLAVLLNLHRGIQRNGGTMRIAGAQPLIRDMLVKCRLDDVLELFPTVDEASR